MENIKLKWQNFNTFCSFSNIFLDIFTLFVFIITSFSRDEQSIALCKVKVGHTDAGAEIGDVQTY